VPTTTRGYRYPLGSAAPNVPLDLANLASDIDTDVGLIYSRPAGRLVQTVTQTLGHNTGVPITFTTEDLDTANYHSTSSNTSRVVPLKAGWYRVYGTVSFTGRTDYTTIEATLDLNGTALAPAHRIPPTTVNQTLVIGTTALIQVNGSTDYFELLARHVNGASASSSTTVSTQFACVLEWELRVPA
jgi:hypothetical protein